MNSLKIIVTLCLLSGFSTLLASFPVGGTFNIEVENEGQSLAKGYALAFDKLPSGAKYVVIKTEEGPQYLPGSVRDIEAIEAVLVIYIDNGPIHIISAYDIVKITNLKPTESR